MLIARPDDPTTAVVRYFGAPIAAVAAVSMAAAEEAPDRVLGRSIYWWLDHLRLLRFTRDSRIGRRLRSRDAFPGRGLDDRHLRAAGIQEVPRLTRADGTTADNSSPNAVKSHVYANAGTYTVFATVTATTPDGSKTTTTSKSVVVP